MKTILLVEDDNSYRKSIKRVLEDAGFFVDDVADAILGIEYFTRKNYDLVISDRVMELMDGIRFLTSVKRIKPSTKTILLTGKPSADSQLDALDIYVDLYLTKDNRTDVFLKYVERVLENNAVMVDETVMVESKTEGIQLFLKRRQVLQAGREVSLTTKEFDMLHLFLTNKGIALSREQIIESLWDESFEMVEERVVDVHLNTIRRKLALSSIISIRGYGYKWDE